MAIIGMSLNKPEVIWDNTATDYQASLNKDGLMSKEDKEFLDLLRLGYTEVNILDLVPSPKGPVYYVKDLKQMPEWVNLVSGSVSISGEVSAIEEGTYTVTFTPSLAYTWSDGTRRPISVEWTIIAPKVIEQDPEQDGILYADKKPKTAKWTNYEEGTCSITDDTGIDAGNYVAYFTPNEGYVWTDGTRDAKPIAWSITAPDMIYNEPEQVGELFYTKDLYQRPSWSTDVDIYTITGDTYCEEAYEYIAIFTPKEGYVWSDGTRNPKRIGWQIKKSDPTLSVDKESITINNFFTEDSSVISTNSDGVVNVVSGNTNVCRVRYDESTKSVYVTYNGIGSTNINISVTGSNNYNDATTTIAVTSTKVELLEDPVQVGTLTYNGSEQQAEWNNDYNHSCTISGDKSTNANSYTATFVLKEGYLWNDGSSDNKEVSWTIGKAEGSITVESNIDIDSVNGNKSVVMSTNSDGNVDVKSNDISICTVSYDSITKQITIVYVSEGTTTIDVVVNNSNNYTDASATIEVKSIQASVIGNPAQAEPLYYEANGIQFPTWNNYIEGSCTIEGTTSANEVGTYTVVFTPIEGYLWSDTKDRSARNINWKIDKAATTITIEENVVLDNVNNEKQVVVKTNSDSADISVVSNDENIVSASYDNNGNITITYVGSGSTTMTVTVGASDHYVEATKDINITANTVSILEDPVQNGTLTYSGESQSPQWNLPNGSYDITNNSETDAGSYTANITPKTGYVWADGSNIAKEATWTIGKAEGSITVEGNIEVNSIVGTNSLIVSTNSDGNSYITITNPNICTATYDNDSKEIVITYKNDGITNITVILEESNNFTESSENITVDCVAVTSIETPIQEGEIYANGQTQYPNWANYMASTCEITGVVEETNSGTYTAIFTPNREYLWADTKDRTPKNIEWVIKAPAVVEIPYQVGELYYDGTEQNAVWNADYSQSCTILNAALTDAGTYNAIFTLSTGYMWSDNTFGPKLIPWTIKSSVELDPNITQNGILTYDGTEQSPAWNNYVDNSCDIENNTGINANTETKYKATFTPKVGYVWNDTKNRESKEFEWVINKASAEVETSEQSIELDNNNLISVVSLTTNSDGEINVSVEDENVCTISYNNETKEITITYASVGTTTINIMVNESSNYTIATGSIEVECKRNMKPVLEENSVSDIAAAAANGTAASLWSISDSIPIVLNGTLGPNTLENVEVGLQIIGFNHNAEIEGNNTIHFQCGVKEGKPIALYWENTPSSQHHASYTNSGGWEQSDLRTRCNEFYNCLPQEWKDVIKTTTKYTNNVGKTESEEAVTATQDKVFLLAEFEVFSYIACANQYEQYKQQQYEYYINGTTYSSWNVRQRAFLRLPGVSVVGSPNTWWLRSPYYNSDNDFCNVHHYGNANYDDANYTSGFAPAFAIS